MNVYQHLDELKDSDGVGNDAIGLHKEFLSLGWHSNFITRIPRTGKTIGNTEFYATKDSIRFKPNDIHILHYGGQGYPINKFQTAPGQKILRFHNITPSSFYKDSTTPEIYTAMRRFESLSYLELATLSISCDAAWCDSPFNAYILKSFDYRSLRVIPICKKYEEFPPITRANNNICFVGRYAPQKKWEDLINFFWIWKSKFPSAKLYCIGSIIGAFDGYFSRLQQLVENLELTDSVLFKTNLSDNEVIHTMQDTSALVSMSEHEGFCLPILEAYGIGIPVFAFDACATRSTMNQAGILFKTKEYNLLAELISEKIMDEAKKSKMIQEQFRSLKYYNDYPWQKVLPYLLRQK